MKKVICEMCSLMIFLSPSILFAENEETTNAVSLLRAKLEQSRQDNRELEVDIILTDEQLKQADPNVLLRVLAQYEQDSKRGVKRLANLYLVKTANLHPVPRIRQEVTTRLVKAEFSGSRSNSNAGQLLKDFTAKDFNDQSKSIIRLALAKANKQKVGGDISVWLSGVADMKDQLPALKELMIDEVSYKNEPNIPFRKWYATTGWAARLARARMGIKEDIERCIELTEAEENSTDRIIRIWPQIGYIRQPEAIEYLKDYLESDKRLRPTNPGWQGELYSSRAMKILANCLENFPEEMKKIGHYTQEEIDLFRKWMSEQREWKIIR